MVEKSFKAGNKSTNYVILFELPFSRTPPQTPH
jgi:hypothetical protein